MKKFKISYLDDGKGGSGFWDGPYSKIELIENKYDPQLTDVKVYVFDEDNVDEEIVSFELFGYKIEPITRPITKPIAPSFPNPYEDDDEDEDNDLDIKPNFEPLPKATSCRRAAADPRGSKVASKRNA